MNIVKIQRADPDILQHYGVKDMHWGVWNDETAARYAGGKKTAKKRSSATKEPSVKAKKVGLATAEVVRGTFAGAAGVAGIAVPGLIMAQPISAVPVAAAALGSAAIAGIMSKGINEIRRDINKNTSTKKPIKNSFNRKEIADIFDNDKNFEKTAVKIAKKEGVDFYNASKDDQWWYAELAAAKRH